MKQGNATMSAEIGSLSTFAIPEKTINIPNITRAPNEQHIIDIIFLTFDKLSI